MKHDTPYLTTDPWVDVSQFHRNMNLPKFVNDPTDAKSLQLSKMMHHPMITSEQPVFPQCYVETIALELMEHGVSGAENECMRISILC